MASSALNTTRQTGGVIGVALLGAIIAGNLATRTTVAFIIGIAACTIAALAALLMIPARHRPDTE